MARALNIWFGALAICSLALLAPGLTGEARADDAKRVVVMDFHGPSSGQVRAQVVDALGERSEITVVSSREAAATAQRLGLSMNNADDLQKVAGEMGVSAFIEGNVEKEHKNLRALIRVRNAGTGEVVHEEPFVRNKKHLKTIGSSFWKVMGAHILATEVPPKPEGSAEPEPEPEKPVARQVEEEEKPSASEEEEVEPEPTEGAGKKSYTHPALFAYLGPRFMWRTLAFDTGNGLSSYDNETGKPAINAALYAAYYPGAHFSHKWYSNLGLELGYDYTLGLKSQQMGKQLSTTALTFDASALYRFPLDSFEPRFRVGYAMQKFSVDGSTTLPAVTYGALKFGAGTFIYILEQLSLDVDIAYLAVLSSGDLGSAKYDPKSSVKAFEAGAGLNYRITGPFGLRLGANFRRYVIDFGSPKTGGGVTLPKSGTDDFFTATIAFVFVIPGMSAGN